VSISGGNITVLATTQRTPSGVAYDASNVYWTATAGVFSLPLTGGSPTSLSSPSYQQYAGLIIVSSNLYWLASYSSGAQGGPMMIPVTGGTASSIGLGTALNPALAFDSTRVYWAPSDNTIKAVGLGGGVAITLATNQSSVQGIVATDEAVYWTVSTVAGAIMSVPTSGGTASPVVNGQNMPFGIVTDGTHLYWTNYGAGTVMRSNMTGGEVATLAKGQGFPCAIAIDATSVYFTAIGDGTVMKITPR
jgi:hypothetical protein